MRPRLWAPGAGRVELIAGEAAHPMRPDGVDPAEGAGGWWEADVDLAPGDRYRFRVDDGPPVPDPRARWLPEGVHGPSAVDDPGAGPGIPGDDPGRPEHPPPAEPGRRVFYEAHVGTFSPEGTFDGMAARLDHLVALGVTDLELLPPNAFAGDHGWGYDGVAWCAPHHRYGTPAELRALIDRAHRLGLRVTIDVVYNHLGPDGAHHAGYTPILTDRYRTPWGPAINVDGADSDAVRSHIIESALMWLEDYGADGLRLDAVHGIIDTSAIHLLEELVAEVRRLEERTGVPRHLIAEWDRSDPRPIHPVTVGGWGLDGQWLDDLHHALHVSLTGERDGYYADYRGTGDVVEALVNGYVYRGRYSPHRRRRHGRPPLGVTTDQLVVALQNHDQIGNRARGERIGMLVGADAQMAAAALVLLSPYTPLVFQGEEWAASTPFPYFVGHGGELGEAVRRGRMEEFTAFGWRPEDVADPVDPATFESARLRWDELGGDPHQRVLDWYRRLLGLRANFTPTPVAAGTVDAHLVGDRAVSMTAAGLTVLANLGPEPLEVELDGDVVAGSHPDVSVRNGRARLEGHRAVVATRM